MKSIVVALSGNISAGKSTLAYNLQREFGSFAILSSDEIRVELGFKRSKGSGGIVFGTMQQRLMDRMLLTCDTILDSTGMSPRYKDLIRELKYANCHLIKIRLYCDGLTWVEREAIRDDRIRSMTEIAYRSSLEDAFKADIEIDTSHRTPEEIVQFVSPLVQKAMKSRLIEAV